MTREYRFQVTSVRRHDEQRQGESTEVTLRRVTAEGQRLGGGDKTIWIEGWHTTERLSELIFEKLQRLGHDLALTDAETEIVGRCYTVSVP